MMKFYLIFKNKYDTEFKLGIKVNDDDLGRRWFECINAQIKINARVREPDRFYNFPITEWNEKLIVDELNKCITVINNEKDYINEGAYVGMPQEHLNILHHYFEKIRGSIANPSHLWNNSGMVVKSAIERYNVLIHRAENYYIAQNRKDFFPRIVCTFSKRNRHLLAPEDYNHFSIIRKYGDVCLNYCEVGKPLYDVFKDGDDIVGEDNIRPQRYYSSDFAIFLHANSEERSVKFMDAMENWWQQKEAELAHLGFIRGAPSNAIGSIHVATINSPLDKNQLIDTLCEYNKMVRIENT